MPSVEETISFGSARSDGRGKDNGVEGVYFPSSSRARMRAGTLGADSSELTWAAKYHRILLVSDALVLAFVTLVAAIVRFDLIGENSTLGKPEGEYLMLSVAIAVVWMLALGMYRSRDSRVVGMGTDEYKRVVSATVTLLGLLSIIFLILKIDVSRGYMAIAFPLGICALIGTRWRLRRWLGRRRTSGHYLSRVIVLGNRKDVSYVIKQLREKSGAAYEVIGVAVPHGVRLSTLEVGNVSFPVVADVSNVVHAASILGADAVVVAGHFKRRADYVQKLGWKLEQSSTELILATGLTNVAGPRIHARPVEGLPLMHVELPQYSGGKHVLKRLMDLVLSAAAILVLLPLWAVLAVLIRRDSEGPAMFKQERVGLAGKTFMMYKFRSMVVTAEDEKEQLVHMNEGSGPLFKIREDPRVTRVGRWMRKYSLDELPQLWNVFIGDMSLVGPRPPLQSEVAAYRRRLYRRLYIKPGLTGMWQINGRSELNWQDSVRLDLYYVENWSVLGDLIILWRTCRVVIKPVGAY